MAEIELTAGETKDLELSLSKLPRGVSDDPTVGWVSIKGWPEDAALIFRGKRLSVPVKYYELKKGKYQGKISRSGYRSETLSVTVVPQKHHEIEFQLKPLDRNKARRLAWMFPGMGHFYGEKPVKGIMWTVLELAMLYGTWSLYNDYMQKSDECDAAYNVYKTALTGIDARADAYREAFDAKVNSQYFLGGAATTAAIVWIFNVVDLNRSTPRVLPFIGDTSISMGMGKNGEVEVNIEF